MCELQIQLPDGEIVRARDLRLINIRAADGTITTLTRCERCRGFFFGAMGHMPRKHQKAGAGYVDTTALCARCAEA